MIEVLKRPEIDETFIKQEVFLRKRVKEVEESSIPELRSYFRYVCAQEANKPYIPFNLIVRGETADEAVTFAKRLIDDESDVTGVKANVKVCSEDTMSLLTIKELSRANDNKILIVNDLKEDKKPSEEDRRKRSKDVSFPWDQVTPIMLEAKNKNSRIIICTTYNRAGQRIDCCRNRLMKSAFTTLFTFDIKLCKKAVEDINSAIISELGRDFEVSQEFEVALEDYNARTYPASSVKGADYVSETYNKIIKKLYGRKIDRRILTSDDVPDTLTGPQSLHDDPLKAINSLVGLANVKKLLKELDGFCRINVEDARNMYLNFVFTGNPGTGKTKVAHLMADLLCSLGVISQNKVVEITPSDLQPRYIGDTSLCVREACERANGGILFIDEAYVLDPQSASNNLKACREEVLALLLKEMDNRKANLTVIFAGYGQEMGSMLKSNPGMRSRIYKEVEFDDYSEDELLEIFKGECEKGGFTFTEETLKKAKEKLHIMKYDKAFGNARTAISVYQEACLLHLENEASGNERSLAPKDIVIESRLPDYESNREELNSLIGLANVKKNIDEITALCRYNAITGNTAVPSVSNMLFTGNPGTGKTTVAKLFGNMLFSLGAVKAPVFVSINAYELNTSLVAGVSEKLQEYCQKAMGGVLFIDEAYAMGEFVGPSASDAINVLLDMMENHRDDLVIILAGYPDKMKEFLDLNPGLRSRIPITIDFEDYSLSEMEEIFAVLCEKNGFSVTGEALENVRDILTSLMHRDDFANARTVRNIFERAYKNHAVSFIEDCCQEDENVISAEDIDVDDFPRGEYVPFGFC